MKRNICLIGILAVVLFSCSNEGVSLPEDSNINPFKVTSSEAIEYASSIISKIEENSTRSSGSYLFDRDRKILYNFIPKK
ncbi:MAG: hypothetical protein NC201_03340 [Prevotella sp.]|nr:hypothetical protein [Bacteroides sp.]MCM1366262.1 hypothetical protein [Prevotella sp.]